MVAIFHFISSVTTDLPTTSTTRMRTKETLTMTTTTTTAVVNLAHYFSAFLNFCARTRCSSYYTVGVCWFSGCSVWQIDSTMLSLRKDSRVFLDFCSLVVLLHAGRVVLSSTGRLEEENVKFPVNNNDFDVGNCGWLVCLPGCNGAIIYIGTRQMLRHGCWADKVRFVYWDLNNFQLFIPCRQLIGASYFETILLKKFPTLTLPKKQLLI